MPLPTPILRTIIISTMSLAGTKRDATSLMEIDLGKRPKGLISTLEAISANLGPILELSLPNFAGSL